MDINEDTYNFWAHNFTSLFFTINTSRLYNEVSTLSYISENIDNGYFTNSPLANPDVYSFLWRDVL